LVSVNREKAPLRRILERTIVVRVVFAMMTLSFFASRDLAKTFLADGLLGDDSLAATAERLLGLFPEALAEYAYVGRCVLGGAQATVDQASPSSAKVGRNDLCPCGSGKKFKRCCGETRH
jgi:hypothetical protein